MHFILGGFLVYTGVQTLIADDDEDSYEQGWFTQMVARNFPIVDRYDKDGAFFIRVDAAPQADTYGSVEDGKKTESLEGNVVGFGRGRDGSHRPDFRCRFDQCRCCAGRQPLPRIFCDFVRDAWAPVGVFHRGDHGADLPTIQVRDWGDPHLHWNETHLQPLVPTPGDRGVIRDA